MTRQEVRLRLTAADQRRVAAIAARYDWSGAALTVWLLMGELDGETVEARLAQAELVAHVTVGPGHDPTVHRSDDGTHFTVAVADIPEMILVGPVPGKATSTLIFPTRPALPAP